MGLVDELLKLEQLHQRGTLSAEEFERAKLKLLESEQQSGVDDRVTRSLDEANYQAELSRIDREWEIERRRYLMTGRYGASYVPTAGSSLLLIFVVGGFGVFWTILAFSMVGGFHGAPFGGLISIFPLFGIVFIAIAVVQGLRGLAKSQQYQEAEAAYQHRRAAVRRSGEK